MNDIHVHLQSELCTENKFWHIASVFINLHRLYLVSSFRSRETVRRLEKWRYQILKIWVHTVGGWKWWVFTLAFNGCKNLKLRFFSFFQSKFRQLCIRSWKGCYRCWLVTSVKTKPNAACVKSLVFLCLVPSPPPSQPTPTRYYGYKPEALSHLCEDQTKCCLRHISSFPLSQVPPHPATAHQILWLQTRSPSLTWFPLRTLTLSLSTHSLFLSCSFIHSTGQ